MKHLLLLLSLMTLVACSSGKKQFEKGNYEEAIAQAVKRLRSNPDNKKARSTLKKAYPMASSLYLDRINRLKKGQTDFKWDEITTSYGYLNTLYDQLSRCPSCMSVLPKIKNYQNEYARAAVLAAEERYEAGLAALKIETRESAKEAYYHFLRVESLQKNYKENPQKLEEAKYYATLHVVLEQIPVHSRSLGLSHEFFQNRLQEELDRRVNEFIRFYSPAEASRTGLQQPDHVVVLQFDDFVVGQVYEKETSKQITRDSVIVGTTKVDGVTYDVYGTVEAEYISSKKFIDSRGLLDLKIYDAQTDRVLLQRKMPGAFTWVSEWATYKGDKRALTEEELELTTLREPPPPSPQFLFEQFCQPIYSQALENIRGFYRSY